MVYVEIAKFDMRVYLDRLKKRLKEETDQVKTL